MAVFYLGNSISYDENTPMRRWASSTTDDWLHKPGGLLVRVVGGHTWRLVLWPTGCGEQEEELTGQRVDSSVARLLASCPAAVDVGLHAMCSKGFVVECRFGPTCEEACGVECCVDPAPRDHHCQGAGSGQSGNNAAGQETAQVGDDTGRGQGVLAVRQADIACGQYGT